MLYQQVSKPLLFLVFPCKNYLSFNMKEVTCSVNKGLNLHYKLHYLLLTTLSTSGLLL